MADNMIGEVLKVTLTTDEVIQGTVMTLCKEQQVLVLLLNPNSKPVDVRMIRLPSIKASELVSDAPADAQLPFHIARDEALPAMADNEPYQRKYTKKLKQADTKRATKFAEIVDNELSVPIGALDVFEKLARVYPETAWADNASTIKAAEGIVVVPSPDWSTPEVKAVSADDAALVERIKKCVGIA